MNSSHMDRVSCAIHLGVAFLQAKQLYHGEFTVLTSMDPELQRKAVHDSTYFSTCLVAYSLGFVEDARVSPMVQSACSFLESGMEGDGFWRFFSKDHPFQSKMTLDIDDTACAAHLLKKYRANFKPGHRETLLANRNSGGLFYTWIFPRVENFFKKEAWQVPPREWAGYFRYLPLWIMTRAKPNDIDSACIANLLIYLGDGDYAQQPAKWILSLLERGEESLHEKWYSGLAIHYMIARAYAEGITSFKTLLPALSARIEHEMGKLSSERHPLYHALAACCLLCIGSTGKNESLQKAIETVLASQEEDGGWPVSPMFWGGRKRLRCWGSREISTALALEALSRYKTAFGKKI